jgi:hypothetical protein
MGKSVRKSDPLQAEQLVNGDGGGDPITMQLFKGAAKEVDTQFVPKSSTLSNYSFDPHAPEFEFIPNATPSTSNVDYFNSERQPVWQKIARAGKQFGTNVVSSIGQGLANTFDIASLARTIKGEVDGSDDRFTSSLFGLTTEEMQKWADGIEERNRIFEDNPGDFNPGDFGWWAKQFASAGTGVGMAIEAVGTTMAIEGLTGGTGTAAALGKLGSLFNKITKGAKGVETMMQAVDVAKGLRSAATLYGTISRYSESRMEATQNYDQIYNELSAQKNEDGTPKFSEEQKKYLASEGGRRTFNLNMALLPLDILGYRTMMFNPISGSGTGLIEKGLEKIGNKWLRRGAQGLIFSGLEGSEEGLQYIAQEEGRNYAKVLGGMDDGRNFLQRVGADVKQDEFWNNFAGGVIGSPIIAGVMKLANKAMTGTRAARLDEAHQNFIQDVGKMDNALSDRIKEYEAAGRDQEASVLRRQFAVQKGLAALQLDAMADKNTAFDAHSNFLSTTLGELNAGKTDVLTDLGFSTTSPEQIEVIKKEFESYVKDAAELKGIYNNVAGKYNKNFVPEITQDYFELNRLLEEGGNTTAGINAQVSKLPDYANLSTSGKAIYSTEYELGALVAEQKRLTKLFRETSDPKEKQAINEVLQDNNKRIEAARETVTKTNTDEAYNETDRTKDGDIIRSALKDKDYTQAIYDREYLNNSISLQRKRIALWNDPQFIAEKTKESISKAKTKEQIQNTAEATAKAGNLTPEVKEQIAEKINEVAAADAAKVVQQQSEAQQAAAEGEQIGNQELFGDDNAFIEAINQEVNNVAEPETIANKQTPNDDNTAAGEEVYLFSPQVYDFNKSSEDSKNRVINGVRGLLDRISDPTFENLVRHVLKVQGEGTAENIFNALKYGWEGNGNATVDYDAVYNKVFGDPLEQLLQGAQGLTIQTAEQLQEVNEVVTQEVVAKQNQPEAFDNNNQPVYVYKGRVTNESSPKMAFLSRLSDLITTKDENGNTIVSHEYTEGELNIGEYVNSLPLLDPDSNNEGTELTISIPSNFMEIKIPVYNPDGTKGQAITFGQYVATKGLVATDQEYQDKVPMIMYRKGAPSNEKGLAFVHDIGWYHPLRFNQEKSDDMTNAISNTRRIRSTVISDSKNKTSIIITGKRQTTFEGLKTSKGELMTLRDANPQTQLTVALTTDTLSTSKTNTVFPNNNTVLVNNSPFNLGQVLEVRRYGTKDGQKSYIALPVFRPKLDEASKNSVLQAIHIYSSRSSTNPDIRTKHDAIVKNIVDIMGLDILNPQGLEKYLQHFITTFNTNKARSNEDVEAQAKDRLSEGTPYIAFIAGGNIVFGKAGRTAFVDRAGVKKGSFFINPNSNSPVTLAMNSLAKPDMIGWYEQNVSLDNLNNNKPISVINNDGTVATAATSYNDYLLGKLQTNIRSYNIGTKENPNYVTNVQPVITYDLTETLSQEMPTNAEVSEIAMPEETTVQEMEQEGEDLSDIEKELLIQAQRDLGSSFGVSKRGENFLSPTPLTTSQREEIGDSIIRIAGLTPDQQFTITNFMYNQITAIVNLDNKQASKTEIDKAVDQTFSQVIAPQKSYYQGKIDQIQTILAKKKSPDLESVLQDYQYVITKIKAVEDNLDILRDEAYAMVAKYTGITETKVNDTKEESEENEETPDFTMEDEANERETDFWTDALTESPENKLTYSMRRFFGQVRQYDKQGQPMTGFLNLPLYMGSDEITRNLMVTLADTPSDFNAMLDKLESRKDALPWMQEVINKLQGATQQRKNQFVTVMSNTSLRMKFTMISFDRKNNTWTTKMYDTNLNGVADAVKTEWKATLIGREGLVVPNEEGDYVINKEAATEVLHQFENWKGATLETLKSDLVPAWDGFVNQVKNDKSLTFSPSQALKNEFGDKTRVRFQMKGKNYQISKIGDKYQIAFLEENVAKPADIRAWLENFGIIISDGTLDELVTRGLFHNYKQRKPNDLFTTGDGLYQILYNKLGGLVAKEGTHNFTEQGDNLLDDTVVNSLANLEAKYNNTSTPFGFRDNGKSLFALTAPKFINDRVRDLKKEDSDVKRQLQSISFSSPSLWLTLLGDIKFRDKFQVSHMGLNAFKELGKKLYRDNGITRLSDVDHELTKLGMFWDTTQGSVSYDTINAEGKTVTNKNYPDTNVSLRMGTMFSPTMSDKSLMTLITTVVLNLENKDLNDGKGITDEIAKILYEQTVKPELKRMIKFYQNGGSTNISAYDQGAGMFLFLPELNNIEYTPGLRLVDAIKHEPNYFTQQYIEGNEDLMNAFKSTIKSYVANLTQEKVEVWRKDGLVVHPHNDKSVLPALRFFDKKYLDKFRGDTQSVANMAAMDFVVNSIIANSNSFMTVAGDPAMYYKSKATDPIQRARDTFVNVGKRLANQIAPGTSLSNSENETYTQLFLNDRKSLAEIPFLKFVTKINDGNEITDAELETLRGNDKAAKSAIANKYPISSGYFGIEGSDAQEYTTWKEHLDILTKLGKTSDTVMDITPDEIREARELFSSGVSKAKLTEKQVQLLGKVLQPIKPVYTGQVYDPKQDVMRTVYIKSSSFPLIPQLTIGMEIDKLRVAMESLERSTKTNVRASYQTANKVGSVNNPVEVWNGDGSINEEALKNIGASTLLLDRKNFRIQQEVPFKSGKTGDDKITLGTQLMKLLFGDEIMTYDDFMYKGEKTTGAQLHKTYNDLFTNLILEKRKQLFTELSLGDDRVPTNINKSMAKLQSILKDEATKRGYPLQDIQGLTLTKDGQFNLPLWSSANSNRYESMLNSIVTNRLIRMKFPGNSYVVGSEEGFRMQENLDGVNQSKIIFTSTWNGKNLQAAYFDSGELKKAQVLVTSKFKDSNGVLIDLMLKEGGQYKYIDQTESGFKLKDGMFEKELLSLISFRIPTSGHQSASQIEIAGFLPAENADLMIVPRNFTKQKGLDFDVDKENTYQFWNYMTPDGKFEILQEKHRNKILANSDKALAKIREGKTPEDKMIAALFGDDVSYSEDDISGDKFLAKLNSKITEKIMQNDIIAINHSVLGSTNPKVQAKINKTLNTDYAEAQADFIESLSASNNSQYWTPLSDEYQKGKMMLGSSGKIGTGAYSLDVVGHSLFQQAAMIGKPLQVIEVVEEEEELISKIKTWKFGNIESNGSLGGTITLDGSRSISEVMSERQNIAVDNEKLQVMGRVGLNDLTMDVDKLMNMLGFDKGRDGNSISFLFLSQPIIREYVELMKNANSNVAEYEANKEDRIVAELIKKYDDSQTEINEDYWNRMSSMMTNENFINGIQSNGGNGQLQAAIIRRFIEMKKYGISIRNIQTTINTDSKGLGKSFFDVIERRNSLNQLGVEAGLVTGATALIGDYIPTEELSITDREEYTKQGYVNIGKFYVKPNTLSGAFNIYGVSTAYNLWSQHFPYDAAITNKAFSEILSVIGNDNMGSTKIVELKQEIFKGIRKYFSASKYSGIISAEDSINGERQRLFIDSDTNTSLASYLKGLKELKGNTIVNTFIKSNKLINRFEYDIQKNGKPSLIKYNNAAGEEFDEQYLYESLSTLMEPRGKDGKIELPTIGNKSYTLDTLAQDLIAYAYLGNSIQEAIQFTKYVPLSYLNTVGFASKMRIAGLWLNDNPNVLGAKIGNKENETHLVSEFTMQYVQHNPERVNYKIDNKTFNKQTIKIDDNSFYLKGEDVPVFISVYDPSLPKGDKKFKLYWFDGTKYNRIPVLGTFGMDEYQPRISIGESIVNGRNKLTINPQATTQQQGEASQGTEESVFSVNSKDINKIVQSIANSDSKYKDLASALLPYAHDIKVEIKGNNIKNPDGSEVGSFDGLYNKAGHTIILNEGIVNDIDIVARVVLHELTHALTVTQLDRHIASIEDEVVTAKDNAPEYVTSLIRLYNSLRKNVSPEGLSRFALKILQNKGVTQEEISKYYAYTNIFEFLAMAMSDKGFQDILNTIPYKQSGQSYFAKFKEIISRMLVALGVKFDKDFTAAHAISNIFEFVEKENLKVEDNPFDNMWTEVINEGNFDNLNEIDYEQGNIDFLNGLDNDSTQGNIENVLSPYVTDYVKTLTPLEKNC